MMVSNRGIPAGLIEATQLTREGRLLEATALIQRVLRRNSAFAENANREAPVRKGGAMSEVIDVEASEVAEPVDGGLTPLQKAAGDDDTPGAELKSLLRKWARRDSPPNVPPPRPRAADG